MLVGNMRISTGKFWTCSGMHCSPPGGASVDALRGAPSNSGRIMSGARHRTYHRTFARDRSRQALAKKNVAVGGCDGGNRIVLVAELVRN